MRIVSQLLHDPKNRHVPRELLIPVRPSPRRPRTAFRLRIRSEEDVARARRVGLPLHLITPDVTASWGFPGSAETVLVVAQILSPLIESRFPVVALVSESSARRPRLEDLIVVLLRRDPLLARTLAVRHSRFLDPDRLLKRILQEDVEEAATLVGLDDVVPALPRSGPALPRPELRRLDSHGWVDGRL